MARIIDGKKKNVIGGNVEKRRKELGMSQKQLSEKLELSAVYICRGSISRIEDYSRMVTDIELCALSETLGVPIDKLIDKTFLTEE